MRTGSQHTHTPSIRLVAKLIGNLVATEEAFPIAPLHYKPIEIDKAEAVEMNDGNYDAHMMLNETSIHEIKWWINNIMDLKYWIHCPPVDKVIYTDASKQGWGQNLMALQPTVDGQIKMSPL